jgi:type IV secretion system protein VirB4
MDEFWQWMNNDAFRDFVYNKLKTGRKLDMVLVVATQSPDELIKSPIAAAVREQCATHIYLANPKAKRNEYVDELQVRELYFDKIKAIDPFRDSSWSSKTHSGRANAMTLRLLQS